MNCSVIHLCVGDEMTEERFAKVAFLVTNVTLDTYFNNEHLNPSLLL